VVKPIGLGQARRHCPYNHRYIFVELPKVFAARIPLRLAWQVKLSLLVSRIGELLLERLQKYNHHGENFI
jgi:hypothetical protein